MASPKYFPPELLPPNFQFRIAMNMSKWGHWDDVDWVRDTLSDANACGVALEDVQVEVWANTWYAHPYLHDLSEIPLVAENKGRIVADCDTRPVENVMHFLKMSGKMIDMAASWVLDEENISKLGGKEGITERVRDYLEEKYGTKGWTCIGVSILAWGKKPLLTK